MAATDITSSRIQIIARIAELYSSYNDFLPYIGNQYFMTHKRVLVICHSTSIKSCNASYINAPLLKHGLNSYQNTRSVPTEMLLGNTSASATLRQRIVSHISEIGLDDIAFCYFLPFYIENLNPKSSQNSKAKATDILINLIEYLDPQQVIFYGNVAKTAEIAEFLTQRKISYETISLRADFDSRKYDANTQDALPQQHGFPKLQQLGNVIKENIDLIPDKVKATIADLLEEIDFMAASSTKNDATDFGSDKKLQKYIFIKRIVQELKAINRTIRMNDLAMLLNANDFKTALGKDFDTDIKSKGVYKLVEATIHYFKDKDRGNDENVVQDITDHLIFNKQPNSGEYFFAPLLSIPLERKYGYKSLRLNVGIGTIQEELEKVFGQDIPEAYAPKLKD